MKGKIVEVGDDNNMDIDDPESSKILLSDNEIEKADKNRLIDLVSRVKKELEIREKIEADLNSSSQTSSPDYSVSTQQLKDTLSKAQSKMESISASISNNDTPNNSNVGGVLTVVSVVGVLAISGIAFVKSKLGKNK